MSEYTEEEYLPLSGIRRYLICRREWALTHVEQQWNETVFSIEGELMHKNAHDAFSHTLRGDVLTVRGLKIHSSRLGLSGECDVVEFHKDDSGVPLAVTEGRWLPYPVEYKRGNGATVEADKAQLCAQAMCLEEMLCCDIAQGALFYGELRHRKTIDFTPALREKVTDTAKQMHALFERGMTPCVKPIKMCNICSLKDICLPKLMRNPSAVAYLNGQLEETP